MKMICDVPEDTYERVMNPDKFYRDIDGEKIRWAVYKGTPIPDDATNGDVLISLYPNLKYTIQNGRVVTTIGVASSFDLGWWNAPYGSSVIEQIRDEYKIPCSLCRHREDTSGLCDMCPAMPREKSK